MGHEVLCFDNLVTGFKSNVDHLIGNSRFSFVEGDIRDIDLLQRKMEGCTHVCHQAALGSVPRSIENPVLTNEINLGGSLNVLSISHSVGIRRFVFASSSWYTEITKTCRRLRKNWKPTIPIRSNQGFLRRLRPSIFSHPWHGDYWPEIL